MGVADDDEPVDGDDGHGERRHVDGYALGYGKERAQDFAEEPFSGKGLDGGEWYGEAAHLQLFHQGILKGEVSLYH